MLHRNFDYPRIFLEDQLDPNDYSGKIYFFHLFMDTIWRMARDQHTKDDLIYAMFCGEAKNVLCITVCSTYIIGTPECGIICMIFENVNISSHAASSFGLVSSATSSRARMFYLTGSVLNDI